MSGYTIADIERSVIKGDNDDFKAIINELSRSKSPVSPAQGPSSIDYFKLTPLHLAAGLGHTGVVKTIFDFEFVALPGVDLGCSTSSDVNARTPLHHAASCKNSSPTLRLLVEHGCDVNKQDSMGRTPAHVAMYTGRNENIQELLSDDNLKSYSENVVDKAGVSLFALAIRCGKFDIAEKLYTLWNCNAKAFSVDSKSGEEESKGGSKEKTGKCADWEKDPAVVFEELVVAAPFATRPGEESPFLRMFSNFVGMVRDNLHLDEDELLFSCGRGLFERLYTSLLMTPTKNLSSEGVDRGATLFRTCLGIVQKFGLVLDAFSFTNGYKWKVECMICHERLSLSDSIKYHRGHTCLSYGAMEGNTKACVAFLDFVDAFPYASSDDEMELKDKKRDPIRWAAKFGHLETVKTLLEHDLFQSYDGSFSLRAAATHGHVEIVEFLLSSSLADTKSVGPALLAVSSVRSGEVAKDERALQIKSLLLEAFDVSAESDDTVAQILFALMSAHSTCSPENILQILTYTGKCKPQMLRSCSLELLSIAARSNRLVLGMPSILLKNTGRLPLRYDSRGCLPIHYVAASGNADLLFELREAYKVADSSLSPFLCPMKPIDGVADRKFNAQNALEILAFSGNVTVLRQIFSGLGLTDCLSTAQQSSLCAQAGRGGFKDVVTLVVAQFPASVGHAYDAAALEGHFGCVTALQNEGYPHLLERQTGRRFGSHRWSLLHLCAFFGDIELAHRLLSSCTPGRLKSFTNMRDSAGYTPLLIAKAFGSQKMVHLLTGLESTDMQSKSHKISMLWKYITHTSERPKPNLPNPAYCGIRFSYEPDEECLHGKVLKYHPPIDTHDGSGLFEVECPNYEREAIETKLLTKKDLFRILDAHPYFEYEVYWHYFETLDDSTPSVGDANDPNLPDDPVSNTEGYDKVHLLNQARLARRSSKASMWKEQIIDGVSMDDLGNNAWLKTCQELSVDTLQEFGGGEFLQEWNFRHTSLLHFSARRGATGLIRALIRGGDPVNLPDTKQEVTPLMYALCYEQVDSVQALLEGGADPFLSCPLPGISDDISPLKCATETKNADLKQLIESAISENKKSNALRQEKLKESKERHRKSKENLKCRLLPTSRQVPVTADAPFLNKVGVLPRLQSQPRPPPRGPPPIVLRGIGSAIASTTHVQGRQPPRPMGKPPPKFQGGRPSRPPPRPPPGRPPIKTNIQSPLVQRTASSIRPRIGSRPGLHQNGMSNRLAKISLKGLPNLKK